MLNYIETLKDIKQQLIALKKKKTSILDQLTKDQFERLLKDGYPVTLSSKECIEFSHEKDAYNVFDSDYFNSLLEGDVVNIKIAGSRIFFDSDFNDFN